MEIIIVCDLLYLGFSNRSDKKERKKLRTKKKKGFWSSYFDSRAKYYKKRTNIGMAAAGTKILQIV